MVAEEDQAAWPRTQGTHMNLAAIARDMIALRGADAGSKRLSKESA